MEWIALGVLALSVSLVLMLVVTGRVAPPSMSEPISTRPPLELPDAPTSRDVDELRLGSAVPGYAPAEVDAALDRRRDRLAEQERALADRESHVQSDA